MSHARAGDLGHPNPAECLGQLERLVSSPSLQGSEALCKLLQYLAHHTLNSPADHLKEYQIGTEVLGRPATSIRKLIPVSACRSGGCAPR